MKIKLFDISDGIIVVNEECLLIPELKAVVDYYSNPIPALSYLHFMYDPASAYNNRPSDEKEEDILEDYPGEYTTEDDVIIDAARKLKKLYTTPTLQFYLDTKVLLEKLGKYGRENEVTSGKDGNYSAMQTQIKSVGTTIEQFKKLEESVQREIEEMGMDVRGQKRLSYDDN
jgi:hypothetical protein